MNKFKLRKTDGYQYRIAYKEAFCVVCAAKFAGSKEVLVEHTILHDGYCYIVPSFHPNCRALFELNPIVYEK